MSKNYGTILSTVSMVLCSLTIIFCIGSNVYSDEVLCSGNRRVWIYEIDTTTGARTGPTWEWVQGDSPQITLGTNAFRTPDECKPIRDGESILITSSYGGVAIVKRATKEATFWGYVENAHSADLLPNDRILVAGSSGADKIYLFEEARPEVVLWSDDCTFAHGIVWDDQRQVAYALSSSQIQVYELGPDWNTSTPSLTQIDTISMPASGGHDMFPVPNDPNMLISTSGDVWIFNRDTEVFTRHPRIGYENSVKSVNVHPTTGQLMYTKSTIPGGTNTYDIEFLDPDFTVHVHHDTDPDPYKIYKVRWNVHGPPAAPIGLSAASGGSTVSLDWNNNTEYNLDSYTVYRSTTSGSGYSEIAADLTASYYVDNSVTNGQVYYYVVTATNTDGSESDDSAEVTGTPPSGGGDTTPPEVPTGLLAASEDGSVSLDWDDNDEPDLDCYTVYRSTTSGSGYSSIVTDLTDSAYVDDTVTNDETYYYVVTATDNSSNESGYSDEDSATPQGSGAGVLQIYWALNETSGTTATDSSGIGNDGTLHGGLTFDNDSVPGSPGNGTALNFDGTDDYVAFPLTEATLPAYTVALWAKADALGQAEWKSIFNNNSSGSDFQLDVDGGNPGNYRYFGSGGEANFGAVTTDWVHIAVACDGADTRLFYNGAYVTTISDAVDSTFGRCEIGRNRGSNKYFDGSIDELRVYEGALNGAEINDLYTGLDTIPPAAPANLTATPGAGNVDLDWDDNGESDLAGYTVYRSFNSGSGYIPIASGLTVSSYIDPIVHCSVTYYYVVTATDTSDNTSTYSDEVFATTPSSPLGDITYDCNVDMLDLEKLSADWLTDNPDSDIAPPPTGDGVVNLLDLAIVAESWLAE